MLRHNIYPDKKNLNTYVLDLSEDLSQKREVVERAEKALEAGKHVARMLQQKEVYPPERTEVDFRNPYIVVLEWHLMKFTCKSPSGAYSGSGFGRLNVKIHTEDFQDIKWSWGSMDRLKTVTSPTPPAEFVKYALDNEEFLIPLELRMLRDAKK